MFFFWVCEGLTLVLWCRRRRRQMHARRRRTPAASWAPRSSGWSWRSRAARCRRGRARAPPRRQARRHAGRWRNSTQVGGAALCNAQVDGAALCNAPRPCQCRSRCALPSNLLSASEAEVQSRKWSRRVSFDPGFLRRLQGECAAPSAGWAASCCRPQRRGRRCGSLSARLCAAGRIAQKSRGAVGCGAPLAICAFA